MPDPYQQQQPTPAPGNFGEPSDFGKWLLQKLLGKSSPSAVLGQAAQVAAVPPPPDQVRAQQPPSEASPSLMEILLGIKSNRQNPPQQR